MLNKKIITAIALSLITLICLSFSNSNADNVADKVTLPSHFTVHVYSNGSGCSSPQSGAKVTVTGYPGGASMDAQTNSNGDADFNIGNNLSLFALFGGHHGTVCNFNVSNGDTVYVCLNDVTC